MSPFLAKGAENKDHPLTRQPRLIRRPQAGLDGPTGTCVAAGCLNFDVRWDFRDNVLARRSQADACNPLGWFAMALGCEGIYCW